VADVLDAVKISRPYKDQEPLRVAAGVIHKQAGTTLDPQLVKLFLEQVVLIRPEEIG